MAYPVLEFDPPPPQKKKKKRKKKKKNCNQGLIQFDQNLKDALHYGQF